MFANQEDILDAILRYSPRYGTALWVPGPWLEKARTRPVVTRKWLRDQLNFKPQQDVQWPFGMLNMVPPSSPIDID